MVVNQQSSTSRRPAIVLNALCALLGTFLGMVAAPTPALAFNCSSGICFCGAADINPANGQPYLPPSQHQDDCTALAAECSRIDGDFTCLTECIGLETCCGGKCTVTP